MAKTKKETGPDQNKIKDHNAELYNIDYLYNKSVNIILDYAADPTNNIKDIYNISNIRFLDALRAVNRGLFAGLDVDTDPLLKAILINVYIDISNKFDKIISLEGFSYISGIQTETIKQYAADAGHVKKTMNIMQYICILYKIYTNNNIIQSDNINIYNIYNNKYNIDLYNNYNTVPPDVITAINGIIYNKLQDMREAGLKARLLSDKQQLGAVAVANREFGWSADRIANEERARALTLSDLPKLTNYVNNNSLPELSET